MEVNEQSRRKRVARLKKIIIFLVVFFLLLPLVICFILGIKIRELSTRIDELTALLNARMESSPGITRTLPEEDTEIPLNEETSENEEEAEELPQTAQHKVYLTFDDGPSVYTDEILDILREYDVKATFFVVGKEDDVSKAAYKRIVDEGHTLAIHSYSHKYGEIYNSLDDYAYDLERLESLLYEVTGTQCKYVRFPGGSSNKVSKVPMSDIIKYIHAQDMEYFDWNISASDAVNTALAPEAILANVTNGIDKYETDVILLHDTGNRKSTVDALPMIIENIKAREGYELLPIDENTELVQHLKIEE
ncbi:MAG: polysaccharide deacetylase [Lachnospiraceae bacterium]|jgi:peptidoglycan/xylan/chitin deacetylase (PgdA/CDA1 family)|nr:polysaccharide deacetylase [Lachnospiraceae bacterium]SDA67723.1 Peptidoglycan/xylan/chitin deacetylase, PgdA/CDA1 family [Lachnospiraceae bacterium G11]